MKKIAIIVLSCIMLASCQSTATKKSIDVPDITSSRPQYPAMEQVTLSEPVPQSVVNNWVKLRGYADQLGIYADGLEQYIDGIRQALK